MTRIYIDADACPVKDEVIRVGGRHGLEMHFVSNAWMRLDESPLIKRMIVAEGPDVADDWIAEHVQADDIVITADIPLARRCLEKGAKVIGSTGKPFTSASIGMAMAMRDLKAHLRETGEIAGTNPGFTRNDRSQFLQALEQAVQDIRRGR